MDVSQFTDWIAFALTICVGVIGVVFTMFLLPGAWVCISAMFLIGVVWKPELISSPWMTFGVANFIALAGEVLEVFASAIGVRRGGGSRLGAFASIIGAIAGALLGAPLLFPLGSFIFAIIGAGLCTVMIERTVHRKQWNEAAVAGTGAAIGRALATIAKSLCTVAIAIIFAIAVIND